MAFKRLSVEEQLQMERARSLSILAEKEQLEEMTIETLVDLDYRQSMSEIGL